MGTFADTYSLRTALANFNGVANAVDGSLSVHWGGTTGGVANTYTVTPSPAWTTDTRSGIRYIFLIPHATNTGATTFNISGIGAVSATYKNQACVGGEFVANVESVLAWDGTNLEALVHGGGWATWTPTYSAGGSMTYTTVTTLLAQYQRHGSTVHFRAYALGTTGGVASNELRMSLPVTAVGNTSGFGGFVIDGAGVDIGGFGYLQSTTTLGARRYDNANFGLGANRGIVLSGTYSA